MDGGDIDIGEELAENRIKSILNFIPLNFCERKAKTLNQNTLPEIEELLFCDAAIGATGVEMAPIGECGDKPGRVGAGGLYVVAPYKYGFE